MLALLDGEYKQLRQLRVLRQTLEARNIAIADTVEFHKVPFKILKFQRQRGKNRKLNSDLYIADDGLTVCFLESFPIISELQLQ